MKNTALESRLNDEIAAFIRSRRSLQLATLDESGAPYASYAPFAIGEECLYVLLSEIAVHGVNLQKQPRASVLIIEDEDTADELYARLRVNYAVEAQLLEYGSDDWQQGLTCLVERFGRRPANLGELRDFRLFRLLPRTGRYVKGFGRAYQLAGNSLTAAVIDHLRDGHQSRQASSG